MDVPALYARFRSEVRDEATPFLWTDPEVYSYMDDAQKMFCRLQGGIADSSSFVTSITATQGEEFIDIDPSILKIRAARRESDGRDIELLNFEDLQNRTMCDDYGFSAGYRLDDSTGRVRSLVLGMEANKLRPVPLPEADETIRLIVYRMPLTAIVGTVQPEHFEIDEQHHIHLLLWMKHLAHMKQDAETYDKGRSQEFGDAFRQYCDQAKAEREKREHKYRTVAYGGL